MTDKYKGVVEIEILGEKRGFKVGTRSVILFCEMENISMNDVDSHLKNGGETVGLKFYHCAAIAYARLMKIPDPSFDDLCAWVDEVSFAKMEIELAKAAEIPNSEAPHLEGQTIKD
jgi:hypothetical protein